MPQKSTKEFRIVMFNETAGGRVSASLTSFLAFDRELTEQTALLVQRWLHRLPPRAPLPQRLTRPVDNGDI